jgi:hypothetical protein
LNSGRSRGLNRLLRLCLLSFGSRLLGRRLGAFGRGRGCGFVLDLLSLLGGGGSLGLLFGLSGLFFGSRSCLNVGLRLGRLR